MSSELSPQEIARLRDEHYNAEVVSVRQIHEDLMILRVVPDQGPLCFEPGQYTLLGLGAWEPRVDSVPIGHSSDSRLSKLVRRAYSISCPMLDEGGRLVTVSRLSYLEFYIARVSRPSDDPPMLTPRLFGLKDGDRLFLGPHPRGRYVLDAVRPEDTVLSFGTGTGEAPHNAHIAELLDRGHPGLIVCATSVRYRRDLAYLETHQQLEKRFDHYHYFPLTTREPENLDASRPDYVGKTHLQDVVKREDYRRLIEGRFDPLTTHAFVCGNPAMLGLPQRDPDGRLSFPKPRGMVETLVDLGLRLDEPHRPGTIHFEKYW